MAYETGNDKQIIVGAAALFVTVAPGEMLDSAVPAPADGTKYVDTLADATTVRNVGYTSNGLELQFQPDFGEVRVDQVLDVAKLYKQGMQVNLNTTLVEATLENLLFAVAGQAGDVDTLSSVEDSTVWNESLGATWDDETAFNISAGQLGSCPVERGLIAVGPGTGDCAVGSELERIYLAYRALSIENVSISAKRDEATMFEVSFRLLPNKYASYGKIVDRTVAATPAP